MRALFATVLCACLVYLASSKVGDVCDSSEDCEVGECCVHIHSFTQSKCRRIRQQGEFCFPDPQSHLELDGKKYKYMCPCAKGLECSAEEVVELELGVLEYKDAKCTAAAASAP